MSDLDALLAGIVADPHNQLRWLIVADWLDDHEQCDRAELLRLHRELIRYCCEVDRHPGRVGWKEQHARIVELIDAGVKPVVPQHTLMLPGGVPLVGNFIPPGSFLMGSDEDSDLAPIHKVTLTKGFFMGIHPVTLAQWCAVLETEPIDFAEHNMPVVAVSFGEVSAFCETASESGDCQLCLPTEAEWEYACRAGTTTHFHFGQVPNTDRINYDGTQTWYQSPRGVQRNQPMEVGTYPPNPWGLFDTHGNVWEMCADAHDERFYERSPELDPVCHEGGECEMVVRGGGFSSSPFYCGSPFRSWCSRDFQSEEVGFRVVFTLT